MWQILCLSNNAVHPRWQIYPNTQSTAPKPQHGATGPCARCHYQEELQNSSCWPLLFKNLKRFPGEPLDSSFQVLLGSHTCPGSRAPWQPYMLEHSPVFHSLSWGSQLWTHSPRQHSSQAWSEHSVTLISHSSYASLLYSFLSTSAITPVHKHARELSYTAYSKNIVINILPLIILWISMVSICYTVQRKNTTRICTTCMFE